MGDETEHPLLAKGHTPEDFFSQSRSFSVDMYYSTKYFYMRYFGNMTF
jgi:hypothetical protein